MLLCAYCTCSAVSSFHVSVIGFLLLANYRSRLQSRWLCIRTTLCAWKWMWVSVSVSAFAQIGVAHTTHMHCQPHNENPFPINSAVHTNWSTRKRNFGEKPEWFRFTRDEWRGVGRPYWQNNKPPTRCQWKMAKTWFTVKNRWHDRARLQQQWHNSN